MRVGLFCEDYPSLEGRQISKIEAEFPRSWGELRDSKKTGLGFYLNQKLGSGVIQLLNLDDVSKYQSFEFAVIGIDELTKNALRVFNILRGSKRWPGISRTYFLAGTNPGGRGHLWVKNYWIDHKYPKEMMPLAKEFAFIRALPSDNPYLDQSYWDELNTLPPDLYKAWVLGDWNVFEGQALTGWNEEIHVIDPFDIPDNWLRWRAVDWGWANPFCCLWFAKSPDIGRTYVYRELYLTGLTDQQQARLIKDNTPPDEHINLTYADPSMWAKKNYEGMMTSTAEEYLKEGIALTRADNDRLSGKRKVDRLLGNLADGKPGLQFFRSCINSIATLPALPRDEHNVEDVDTSAEDHAYDALKYGLTNTSIAAQKKAQPRMFDPVASGVL